MTASAVGFHKRSPIEIRTILACGVICGLISSTLMLLASGASAL
jgi:hypothetical protein